MLVVTTYSDYRGFGNATFPLRITHAQGGFPILDLTVREVQPNAPADIQLPDAVKTATERVAVDKVADGVWFLGGGSRNSVAIEMKDFMTLVETPLNDGRRLPVIAEVTTIMMRLRIAAPAAPSAAAHNPYAVIAYRPPSPAGIVIVVPVTAMKPLGSSSSVFHEMEA